MMAVSGRIELPSQASEACARSIELRDYLVTRRGIEPRALGLERPVRPSGRAVMVPPE
jgi:hypothetical protein